MILLSFIPLLSTIYQNVQIVMKLLKLFALFLIYIFSFFLKRLTNNITSENLSYYSEFLACWILCIENNLADGLTYFSVKKYVKML